MLGKDVKGLNRTVHTTKEWLNEIGDEMGPGDEQMAYHALRGTLFTLRDRISVEQATNLAAQLPTLIRGIYFEGYKPQDTPQTYRSQEEFLDRVNEHLQTPDGANPEEAARAVFTVMNRRLSLGQIEGVRKMLPEKIRALWPEPEAEPEASA